MSTNQQRKDLIDLLWDIQLQLRKGASMGQIITMLETAMTEAQSIFDQEV